MVKYFQNWKDKELLASIYRNIEHPNVQTNPYSFVDDIGSRIFTEWCLESEDNSSHYLSYNGRGFEDFINREIHFLLCRQHHAQLRPSNQASSKEDYQVLKEKVFEGLVKRAIYLSNKLDGIDNSRVMENLRCNLQAYIEE